MTNKHLCTCSSTKANAQQWPNASTIAQSSYAGAEHKMNGACQITDNI
uniref:Uncharacterized protein n=1 Tax=Anguilla anguilla TaxID=7936 RepID=A0A0E9TBK6_ANGAN